MTYKLSDLESSSRVARELEREQRERILNDEQRTGTAIEDEFRLKDARENFGSANLKRPSGR
jgi:hypothetical protein